MNTAPPATDPLVPDGMTAALSMQSLPDPDTLAMPIDSDAPSLSRSNSGLNLDDTMSGTSNGKTKGSRKDKGKGKEVDKALIRVKEEEMVPSLSPDPVAGPVSFFFVFLVFQYLTMSHKLNEDHCSACAYMGSLVYCDGCPKAYHLWCLDPPMEPADVPEGDKWFCASCTIRKVRPSCQNFCLLLTTILGYAEPAAETTTFTYVASINASSNKCKHSTRVSDS
jgi:hypothetical protein